MNDDAPTTTEPDDDLLAEWGELSRPGKWFAVAADDDRTPAWIMPVLILYVGFFFGPFITLFIAVLAAKGRTSIRRGAIIFGLAGTAWCLLQGVSVFKGGMWSEYQLQMFRSSANFLAGIAMYVTVRPIVVARFKTTVLTVFGTLLVALIGTIAFVLLPSRLLIFMGR